jgi:hypothetical protein
MSRTTLPASRMWSAAPVTRIPIGTCPDASLRYPVISNPRIVTKRWESIAIMAFCPAGTSSDEPSSTTRSPGAAAKVMGSPGRPEALISTFCSYTPSRTYTVAPEPTESAAWWSVAHGSSRVPGPASSPSIATQ